MEDGVALPVYCLVYLQAFTDWNVCVPYGAAGDDESEVVDALIGIDSQDEDRIQCKYLAQ